jgi:hypothetical protein
MNKPARDSLFSEELVAAPPIGESNWKQICPSSDNASSPWPKTLIRRLSTSMPTIPLLSLARETPTCPRAWKGPSQRLTRQVLLNLHQRSAMPLDKHCGNGS